MFAILSGVLFWGTLSFSVMAGVASFFEWLLHRFIMHRPLGKFRYPFERHALIHHNVFKADHTYHLINDKDKKTIPMAWWNGPALILIGTLIIPVPVGLAFFQGWELFAVIAGGALAVAAYYATYEYIHWCMHLPRRRNVERTGIFFRLNGHHLLHHRYMHRNFNVVFPLADLCLGTLLLRSKIHFKQAEGPSVPNVQPKVRRTPEPVTG